ncbi:MAG: uL15 family ribosomal protein, partial [Clostridia bacterium]|nr:uL15 family ribosomal protein [Clostridia bacterium]
EKLDRLEAAELALAIATVSEEIDDLPGSDEITTADKAAIEAARKAYEALTQEQKAEFPKEKLDRLEAAELALAIATVSEEIDDLPGSDEITTADKDAIEAARAAYEALTQEQKAAFPKEKLDKLEAAELALAVATVFEMIEALPEATDVTTADKDAIEAAHAAYEALSAEEKTVLAQGAVRKLEAAKSAYRVEEVKELIANIGTVQYDETSKARIDEAKAAYNALTPDEQARVNNANVLSAAETTYEQKGEEEAEANYGVPGGIIAGLIIVSIAIVAAGCFLVLMLMQYSKNRKQVKMRSSALGFPLLAAAGAAARSAGVALYVLIGVFALIAIADILLFVKNRKDKAAAQEKAGKPAEGEQGKQEAQASVAAAPAGQEPTQGEAVPAAAMETVEEESDDGDESETVIVVEENGNRFNIRYQKSFLAKLIQSDDETKAFYGELKNEVLSYGKVNSRVSWGYDSVNSGRKQVLKFGMRGKTLCVYYALNAEDFKDTKYKVELCESKKFETVPCMYRIKNARRCGYAKDLIAKVAENLGLVKGEQKAETYDFPYEETSALLEKGLVKELKTQIEDSPAAQKTVKPSVRSVSVMEADAAMSDEAAATYVETVADGKAHVGKKGVLNIDVIGYAFKDGDTVDIEALREKKLIPNKVGFVKVLARGALDKKLHFALQDYSIQAVKMIVLKGGTVKKAK